MSRRLRSKVKPRGEEAEATTQDRVHYRRCHICSHVSEISGSQVRQCGECGKPMAPFFFFDEQQATPPSDVGARPEPQMGDRAPIWGFTAFW